MELAHIGVRSDQSAAALHDPRCLVRELPHTIEHSRPSERRQTPLDEIVMADFCVRLGDLNRAEGLLHRALETRSPIQFHETTGAVFDTLAQIHDYWRVLREPPLTVRRESPKIGRNDPCPCGSGKKFKKCHGA